MISFKLDFVDASGNISNYYPDFLVKTSPTEIYIVETKGQEELDLPQKLDRLRQWCEDINRTKRGVNYDFLYVDEENYKKYRPSSFKQLTVSFTRFKPK